MARPGCVYVGQLFLVLLTFCHTSSPLHPAGLCPLFENFYPSVPLTYPNCRFSTDLFSPSLRRLVSSWHPVVGSSSVSAPLRTALTAFYVPPHDGAHVCLLCVLFVLGGIGPYFLRCIPTAFEREPVCYVSCVAILPPVTFGAYAKFSSATTYLSKSTYTLCYLTAVGVALLFPPHRRSLFFTDPCRHETCWCCTTGPF